MGRLTMFEDLFDADPPMPGLHEFARVTERARGMRRRRARTAVWATLAAGLALGGAGIWASHRTPPSAVTPADQDTVPATTPSAPATSAPESTPSTSATSPALPRYPLGEVGAAGELPAVALGPEVHTFSTADGTTIELTGGGDGSACARPSDTQTQTCSNGPTGLLVVSWPGADSTTTAFVVDASVDVAFVAVGAGCVPATTDDLPVVARVWVCTSLDTPRAYADIVNPWYVLIGVPADRE